MVTLLPSLRPTPGLLFITSVFPWPLLMWESLHKVCQVHFCPAVNPSTTLGQTPTLTSQCITICQIRICYGPGRKLIQGCGSRVLVLLAEGSLNPRKRGGDELYRFAREACYWPDVLEAGQTFRVEAKVASCTDVPSTLLVQARLRDAICDAMRDAGSLPSSSILHSPTFSSLVLDFAFPNFHRSCRDLDHCI